MIFINISINYVDEDGEKHIYDDPSDFHYYYNKFNDFLVLEYNFLGRHTYIDNCPHCNRNFSRGYVLESGKKVCMCQINKIIRKEKLIKINDIKKGV